MWSISAIFKIFATNTGPKVLEWGRWRESLLNSSVYKSRNGRFGDLRGLCSVGPQSQLWVEKPDSKLAQVSIHSITQSASGAFDICTLLPKTQHSRAQDLPDPLNTWGTLQKKQYQVCSWQIRHRNLDSSVNRDWSLTTWWMLLKTGLKHLGEFSLAIPEPKCQRANPSLTCFLCTMGFCARTQGQGTRWEHCGGWRPVSMSPLPGTALSQVMFKHSACALTHEAILQGCCVCINEQTPFGFPKTPDFFFPHSFSS